MRFYHTTNFSNLDSILEKGLEARNTIHNNFPRCDMNNFSGVFAWRSLEQAKWWENEFIAPCDTDDGYFDEERFVFEPEVAIVEFEAYGFGTESFSIPYHKDTNCLWGEYSDFDKDYAIVFRRRIPAYWIKDIH